MIGYRSIPNLRILIMTSMTLIYVALTTYSAHINYVYKHSGHIILIALFALIAIDKKYNLVFSTPAYKVIFALVHKQKKFAI